MRDRIVLKQMRKPAGEEKMGKFGVAAILFLCVALACGTGCKPGEPLAGFTATPMSGVAPLAVQFTDASRIVKAAEIVSWAWDFGDGATSTEQNPQHTYTTAGSYTVSLTVTSNKNKTSTATPATPIVVSPPALVAVPDITGMTQANAVAALRAAGLAEGVITQSASATVPLGQVISQNPTAGTDVAPGTAVSFVVSLGLVQVAVPNLVGLTEAEAYAALEDVGLALGAIVEQADAVVPAGQVIAQGVTAGTMLITGSAVGFVVSMGAVPLIGAGLSSDTLSSIAGFFEVNVENLGLGTMNWQAEITQGSGWVRIAGPASGTNAGAVRFGFLTNAGVSDRTAEITITAAGAANGPVVITVTQPPAVPGQEATVYLWPNYTPLVMVWVQAGSFAMGAYSGEPDSLANETPQHSVALAGFWMGKYEITKEQWNAVMGTNPWEGGSPVSTDPASPAVAINWDAAKAFCSTISNMGLTFALPSEAQWEYACRGGFQTAYFWGDDPLSLDSYAWWRGNGYDAGGAACHVVGQKLPNNFNLHDMIGNAFEWCEDDRHDSYEGAPADGSAWVDSPRAAERVRRGGSTYSTAQYSRCAARFFGNTVDAYPTWGLRVVMTD